MTKHIVSNHQVAHLWANQSQEWARNGHDSVSFNGRFYSSYRTAVARITDAYLRDKQVVLIANSRWGVTTARHIHNAHDAMHGHDQYHVMSVEMVQSTRWGEKDQIPHTINIETMFKAYQAACERYCKPRSYFWGYYDQPEGTPSGDTLANRQRAIYAAARPYREYCMAFGYEEPYPNFEYWIYKLNAAWARYYDPATANAREARDAKARMREFNALSHIHAWIEGVYAYASNKKDDEYLVQHSVKGLSRRLRREVEHRVRSIINPYRPNERITPEQWMNGEGASWFHGYDYGQMSTLLRRKGDVLQTSRGAEVPWQDAVRAFALAQRTRCNGYEYIPQAIRYGIGGFPLTRIDSDGTLHVGCHHLRYDEMQRLAIREAPEVVRPCYPVPAQYAGDYRDVHIDPPTLANMLVSRPRGFKCGDEYCSYCGDKYDGDYQCD